VVVGRCGWEYICFFYEDEGEKRDHGEISKEEWKSALSVFCPHLPDHQKPHSHLLLLGWLDG